MRVPAELLERADVALRSLEKISRKEALDRRANAVIQLYVEKAKREGLPAKSFD
jgi:hypothetical protein